MREIIFTTVGSEPAVTTYVAAKALIDDGSSFATTQMTLLGDLRLLEYDKVTIETDRKVSVLTNNRRDRVWEYGDRYWRYGYDLHRLWLKGEFDG